MYEAGRSVSLLHSSNTESQINSLGGIHNRRRLIFTIFEPPPPRSSHLLLVIYYYNRLLVDPPPSPNESTSFMDAPLEQLTLCRLRDLSIREFLNIVANLIVIA